MASSTTAPGPAGPVTTSTALIRRVTEKNRSRLVTLVPLVVLVGLILVVALRQPNFLNITSVRGLLESMAPILLLAIGQMFVILTGGIDLSFAVTASFGTVLLALWIPMMGPGGVLLMLAALALIGFINGYVVAVAQVPSFIVTLGSLGLYTGLGLWVSGASTIRISEGFEALSWLADARVAQLPLVGVLSIALAVIVAVAMWALNRGRSLHAMGLAEPAVLMSGVSTRRLRVLAFTLCSLFAGFAAIALAAAQRSGGPTLADTLQLPAIAAVVIGGTAITGGVGGAIKTLIGALIIVVLRVGLTAMGVDPAYEQIVYGAVIILAVALTIDRSRLRSIK
ncbi:ABC transporter permease [Microbacterium sp. zg.B48]|uniref:ABC transporter permease n=1 Tax=unclassified Microbacterium TaxID=2609290 RepID=UPI00214BFE62|nr:MULTISPECIES: ABC transporter permease [unclassified Microbacterium]MCR2762820.1 ABC transporter permease [Microbacterium sp. zg.B48]MCR2808383.1 ABC transporter permease [Microbacterium sp. zg.B185]WIM19171.1 ABC transporter permease [Microbacterium sp. zg-B185]